MLRVATTPTNQVKPTMYPDIMLPLVITIGSTFNTDFESLGTVSTTR